jgi:hypothetical protein
MKGRSPRYRVLAVFSTTGNKKASPETDETSIPIVKQIYVKQIYLLRRLDFNTCSEGLVK